ncbi:MAG TPA: sigma-70 family RNA polymerase sigma factor [Pyrinomonadaceae bacterium]
MLADDEAIIAGFLNGEREALETVEGWIERAASPFRRRLFSHWDDLQQAARMEVTRVLRQGKFRGESSLKTYLWQVVNHACINHVRALSRQPSVDLESISQRPSSSDGSPLDQILEKESEEILLRVLEEMPAACRELWNMILAGLSYREMSLRHGVSEGTLRVRVLRCRKSALAVRQQLIAGAQGARL